MLWSFFYHKPHYVKISFEKLHISFLLAQCKTKCDWNLKLLQLHNDLTFLISCWPCIFRYSTLDIILTWSHSVPNYLCYNILLIRVSKQQKWLIIILSIRRTCTLVYKNPFNCIDKCRRLQREKLLSLNFKIRMTSQINVLRSTIEENNELYFVALKKCK